MKVHFQISSIIVALLFVYAINFKSVLTFNYFANQSEIAELFCINKEKPQLHCNGKCHLASQLTRVDDNKEDIPFSQQILNYNLEITPIMVDVDFETEGTLSQIENILFVFIERNLSNGFTSIIAPPPKYFL